MLLDSDKYFLSKQNIDIELVDCFNERTQEVTFKDGTVRTCTQNFTRIMGYCVPIHHTANIGKLQEYKDRKGFIVNEKTI